MIRARCKDYVKKQRTVRRTLACFSQPDDEQDIIKEGAGLTSEVIAPTPKKKTKVKTGRIEKAIKAETKPSEMSIATLCPEPYVCPCSDPMTCKLCAFLRLADKYALSLDPRLLTYL